MAPAIPEIVHGSELEYKALGFKHRVGEPEFKYLFRGKDSTPENYMLALARQKKFYSPPHKHNFDQFRFAYQGDFSISETMTIKEGELCYHPEGVEYGPQNDEEDGTDHILLVLQFGGASEQGYLSYEQLLSIQGELKNHGRFDGGKFYDDKGGNPKTDLRLRGSILTPDNFTWRKFENGGVSGAVYRKHLGTFTERAVVAEMVKVEQGGMLVLTPVDALQLVFIYKGEGETSNGKVFNESALRITSGFQVTLHSMSTLEALRLVLPPL